MLKKSIVYLVIVYAIQILNVVLNIVLIRSLSLENLGQITLAKVYFQFMDFMHLGSRFTLDRFVPTANEENGKKLTVFAMTISFFTSFIFLFIVYFFMTSNTIVLIFMISGFIFAQGTIYKAYFRAKEKTKEMIQVVLITMFFPLVAQVVAISFFNFNIYLISFISSYVAGFLILVYHFKLIKIMPLSVLLNHIKTLYKATGLLFMTSLVVFFSSAIDKILLEHYRGSAILGEYSIILFVFATLMVIPGTLAELVFPKIIKKVIATKRIIYFKEMAFIFFPTLLAVIVANLVMNFFISKFTDYSYLLPYLHLISWGVLPYAFVSIMYNTLNALDKRKTILLINSFVLMIYVVCVCVVIYLNTNILLYLVWTRIFYGILLVSVYLMVIYRIDPNMERHK